MRTLGALFAGFFLLLSKGHAFAPSRPSFIPLQSVNSNLQYLAMDPASRPNSCLFLSATDPSQDGEKLQALFAQTCDSDGLMTKDALKSIPSIAELLEDGELLPQELDDIWGAAPKFPTADDKIDVDSFIQVYRDIDDLFEIVQDDEETVAENIPLPSKAKEQDEKMPAAEEGDLEMDPDERDMESVFETICNSDKLLSKDEIQSWDELQKLMQEGLLGADEFEEIWSNTPKSPGTQSLDVEGFLSFNVALDDLFVFDDDDEIDDLMVEEVKATEAAATKPKKKQMVSGEDLPPGVLFAALANEDYRVGRDEMRCWSELMEMIADGDLTPTEFEEIYSKHTKDDKLDEAGFISVYEAVDALFEDVDEEEEAKEAQAANTQHKAELLSIVETMNRDDSRLPCGLESLPSEQTRILKIVSALEDDQSNVIRQKEGNIDNKDLVGKWELLYTNSGALQFNKGLSGVAGSIPNGKFGGLTQELSSTKFTSDVEYLEHIEVVPSSASFDVKVSGDWDLRKSVSLFTGEPSTVLSVEPGRVEYGITNMRADHWKSLGPMNMLDVTYLDNDLRIMRGNTSTDTIFVFKRTT